jgi:hypothetical protein
LININLTLLKLLPKSIIKEKLFSDSTGKLCQMFQRRKGSESGKPEVTESDTLKVKLKRRLSLPHGNPRTRLERSPSALR